ncbi:transcription factor HHO3 [Magnolia sinica]|uniref:transcription factor HHO3 n=1 Tax=Magnolia sinica TaxID=86752 RepID=UPI002658A26D|nr:transcription factor HHO3 [Magnolia sinica]
MPPIFYSILSLLFLFFYRKYILSPSHILRSLILSISGLSLSGPVDARKLPSFSISDTRKHSQFNLPTHNSVHKIEIMDHAEQERRAHEYISALEEERRKIQVFHRELPLCLQLVTEAIDNYKQLMMTELVYPSRSECEETSNDSPVLEEFIPLKRCSSSEEEKSKEKDDESGKKPDWLKSVQLWNPSPDPPPKEDPPPKPSIVETKKSGGAFHPFEKEKPTMAMTPMSDHSASSTAEKCSSGRGGEEKEGQSNRKARRCWSPELHRRFLHALQQLGGSHAATPKQIRELMKVDGLTNDEVKSHLQKYRLHTRRPASTIQNCTSSSQPPQFVVVGGILFQPPEYSAAAATSSAVQPNEASTSVTTNNIYAPIATLPHQHGNSLHQRPAVGPMQSDGRGSPEERSSLAYGNVNSNSPTTSTSSHTTTTSPEL